MRKPDKICPPQWPLRFLRFIVRREFLEEIEGDMEEVFHDNLAYMSLRKARLRYTFDTLNLLRPILIRNINATYLTNHHGMFKNYFKISFRGLMKNPMSSFINIFGLSLAIGVCVFGYSFVRWTFSTDQFHENKYEVYLATFSANRDGTEQEYGIAPRPLGEMLKQDFPQIKKICRVEDRNMVVKYEDNVFYERVRFADADFLEMFTFPLKWGSRGTLADLNSVILSEEMSDKYFGQENPVGRIITLRIDNEHSKAFEVTGVAEAFPAAHTIDFAFLIHFENLRFFEPSYDAHDWSEFVGATLIQVEDPSDIKMIEGGMDKYRTLQNESAEKDWAISSYSFQPLATLHERSHEIKEDISRGSSENYTSSVFFAVICAFMLSLACFNYINIAIVSAAKRLKEIGLRKSIGATRGTVIIQFLTENFVITLFALIMGVTIAMTLFIPWFENMFQFNMGFKLTDGVLWIYLPAILIFTAIASGIYPAFYISRFQVVGILKGSVKFGKKNSLTKALLAFQLVLACILITTAVVFTQNTTYIANRSWGYDQGGVLYAAVPDQSAFEQLSAAVEQEPDVISISGSEHHLGRNSIPTVIHLPERDVEVDRLSVGARYFSTMGLRLKEGRFFHDHAEADKQTVIVNDQLVRNMGWDEPVGQQFKINSTQYEVVGVVHDFHHQNFYNKIRPIMFTVAGEESFHWLSLRTRPGTTMATYEATEKYWAQLFPETPFQGGYQEDVWGFYFTDIQNHSSFFKLMAFIALLLAGLGLYGLMTLNVSGRAREFSIRKVLGAGLKNISGNISSQYLLLFGISLAVAAPISHVIAVNLIDFAYSYHMTVNLSGVAVAVGILITVLLVTVGTQIRKVFRSNPVEGLKIE